jgi:hypothetical protein
VAKTGLSVGGKFVEHRNTVWQLEGKFEDNQAHLSSQVETT